MKPRKLLFFVPLGLTVAGLTACASLFGDETLKIRPVDSMSSLTTIGRDPLYESAVTAINSRDYARALDYLQEAKVRDPGNIKVLNALGVVYDKLGRFDLSARYYAQARAVDPSSKIVAANIGYSRILQGLQGVDEHSVIAALEAPGGKALPTEGPAATPSSPEAATARAATEGEKSMIAPNPAPSIISDVTSGSAVKSLAGPVVVGSVPANVVALAVPDTEKKTAVPPVSSASVAPVVRPEERQTIALVASFEAKPDEKGGVVTAPKVPTNITQVTPVIENLGVAQPVQSASVASVSRLIDKQTVALISPTGAVPEAKERAIAAPKSPAINAPVVLVAGKQAVGPLVHSASVSPVDRPAVKQTVALIGPNGAMAETKAGAVAASKSPAVIAPGAPTTEELAVAIPVRSASVAPVIHPQRVQAIALRGPLVVKLSSVVTEARITIPAVSRAPAAFSAAVGPAVPINPVLNVPANRKLLTIGKPVKILNGSGKASGAGPVSHRLTVLGWSVWQSNWRMQPTTTLYFPVKNIVAARALLRTLPFPARFSPDNNEASAMRLVIGRDYLSWKPKNSRLAALWQKGSLVASLQKPLTRGVR